MKAIPPSPPLVRSSALAAASPRSPTTGMPPAAPGMAGRGCETSGSQTISAAAPASAARGARAGGGCGGPGRHNSHAPAPAWLRVDGEVLERRAAEGAVALARLLL